jgi:hypothetical protein
MDPPSWEGISKKFPNRNGLIVQPSELEELNVLGRGGCAQRKPIMVLFDDSVAVIVRGKNGKVIDEFNLPAGGSAADFDVWHKALENGQDASGKSVRLGDYDYGA